MDKETITITIKASTKSSIGDHFEDERRFEISVPNRADVSKLLDDFTTLINAQPEWEQ